MSSPKHLWSGDWDRHSSPDPAPPAKIESAPPPKTPESEPQGPRTTRRALWLSSSAGALIIVIVVVVLIVTSGGSKSTTTPSAQAQVPSATVPNPNSGGGSVVPTTPQGQSPTTTQQGQSPSLPSAVQSGPTYSWLGMQISSTGSGVTVATIDPGGAADSAGVDPGDVIAEINGRQINTIDQLNSAVSSLAIGKTFSLTVDRGSTVVSITPTLANRPKRQ